LETEHPTINLYYEDKVVYVSAGFELDYKVRAKLNWIREIERPYFLAGITYCDHYPHDEGSNLWIFELDKEEGLKAVCQPHELDTIESSMRKDSESCETSSST
jgi:hypothetical protein